MIVEMPGERAVGELIGAQFIHQSFLAEPSISFYKDLAELTVAALEQVDILYVHTKGPDEPGHDGDPLRKAEVIEMIDSIFLRIILSQIILDKIILVITSDHATPCELKVHSADPVPLAILKPGWQPDKVQKYSELDCSYGRLGSVLGQDLLGLIKSDWQ